MSQYNKLWIALGGAVVAVVNVIWGEVIGAKVQEVVTIGTPLLTALFVYLVPNKA